MLKIGWSFGKQTHGYKSDIDMTKQSCPDNIQLSH